MLLQESDKHTQKEIEVFSPEIYMDQTLHSQPHIHICLSVIILYYLDSKTNQLFASIIESIAE